MAWTHAILLLFPRASAPVEDYDSHWHYAKQQRKRRQQAKALRDSVKEIVPPTPVLRPVVLELRHEIASTVRSKAAFGIIPVINVQVANVVPSSVVASVAEARALPIASVMAGVSTQSGVKSMASIRVVDVISELRDLEDMIDLYQILLDA